MNNIPIANPLLQYKSCEDEINKAVKRVVDSGYYVLGNECKNFENAFAEYVNCDYCVSVANGTDAIVLALKAIGVESGDEVITTSHTANATVTAIELAGAIPVLADIEQDSRCLCPQSVKRLISEKTKAVVAVHIFGQPANLSELQNITDQNNLFLIEDCAQAHGASYHEKPVGSFGSVSTFSFYPTKIIGALGDGGAIVCNDADIYEKLIMLRQYGWKEKFSSHILGYNSRLDEIQAAILNCKLDKADRSLKRRLDIAAKYIAACEKSEICPPAEIKNTIHAYHLFVIETNSRDDLEQHFINQGIGVARHYPTPIHLQPAYVNKVRIDANMDNTNRLYSRMLSIPIYAELEDSEVDYICESLKSWKS